MSSSLDSTAQSGNSDWQEEVYQKIKVMKDTYITELHETYQKICSKLQQNESLPQQSRSDGVEKLKVFKQVLERILHLLQTPKNSIQLAHKEKLASLEKQILSIVGSNRPRKPGPLLQQGQIPPHMQSLQQTQQSHIPQTQSHDSGVNSQLQSVNGQVSSVPTTQPSNISALHGQGNTSSSVQQVTMESIQQNPHNSNILSSQCLKQQHEQRIMQRQQSQQLMLEECISRMEASQARFEAQLSKFGNQGTMGRMSQREADETDTDEEGTESGGTATRAKMHGRKRSRARWCSVTFLVQHAASPSPTKEDGSPKRKRSSDELKH